MNVAILSSPHMTLRQAQGQLHVCLLVVTLGSKEGLSNGQHSVIVLYGNYRVPLSIRFLSILVVPTDYTYES